MRVIYVFCRKGDKIMLDKTINLSISVKESILFSLKESTDEFSQELLYLSALMLYKRKIIIR